MSGCNSANGDSSTMTDEMVADSGGDASVRRKKSRTTFLSSQIHELERQFDRKKYLTSLERAEVATLLNISEQQVHYAYNNWQGSLACGGPV